MLFFKWDRLHFTIVGYSKIYLIFVLVLIREIDVLISKYTKSLVDLEILDLSIATCNVLGKHR